MNRPLPPFRLCPWDLKLGDGPFPPADASVCWDGQDYLLRRAHRHVFFYQSQDGSLPQRTWALTTPLPPQNDLEADELVNFFRREMELGNIARYICIKEHDRWFPLLANLEGIGHCCEYWNETTIEFLHAIPREDLLLQPDSEIEGRVRDCFFEEVEPELAESYAYDQPDLHWLCGSREGLAELLGLISALEKAIGGAPVKFTISAETIPKSAALFEVKFRKFAGYFRKVDKRPTWFLQSESCKFSVYGSSTTVEGRELERLPGDRFFDLVQLALDYNTPAGHQWEYRDEGSGLYLNYPRPIELEITAEPTTTEDAGDVARNRLREWLVGKATPDEIARLLK